MADIASLKSKLLARQNELSDLLNNYISDHEGRQTLDSFIEVADVGEKSVDDFLKDLDIAVITQEVKELKGINAALRRINDGEYGVCIDCAKEISAARLEINPAAERCIDCQTRFEKEHATKDFNPSL
ncbi:TraR/DksA family transcriptional regulator [Kaarinaea lacus]